MIKAVKRIYCLLLVCVLSCGMIFANYPVLDISNLMNGINQLYSTYDQINAAIEQVQNTYQQLQKQIESVKNINWDDVGESFSEGNWSDNAWENIGNFRTNLKDATSAINDNMNRIQAVKNTLENKTVTFGGKSYSVAGLFGIGKYGKNTILNLPMNMYEYAKETGKEAAKGWAEGLTYEEKQKVMKKWGLSPENYAVVKFVEEQANNAFGALITEGSEEYYSAAMNAITKENKAIDDMVKGSGESIVASMNVTTNAILQLKMQLANLSRGFNQYGAAFAKSEAHKQALEEAEKDAAYVREEKRKLEYLENTGHFPEGF